MAGLCGKGQSQRLASVKRSNYQFFQLYKGKTYGLLRIPLAPTLPKEKSLTEMIAKHFDPKPAMIAEKFKFRKREQLPGESLADCIAEQHSLATCTHYEFGRCLNDALRDRLITQRRLLTVKNLTLQEAIEAALSMEAAEKDLKALHGGKGPNKTYSSHL